jgi:hypothetical protein
MSITTPPIRPPHQVPRASLVAIFGGHNPSGDAIIRQVYEVDLLLCSHCGGRLRVIAVIELACALLPVCACLSPRNLSACNAQAGGRQVQSAYRPLSACGHAQAGGGAGRRTGRRSGADRGPGVPDPLIV